MFSQNEKIDFGIIIIGIEMIEEFFVLSVLFFSVDDDERVFLGPEKKTKKRKKKQRRERVFF